jgi:polyisoprenoid-binding protein YceI
MNTNTYKAMSYEKYPNVTFSNIQLENNASKYLAKGDLTITGTKKNISIPVSISKIENERVLIKGSYTFNMSSFGVEPPEVMWGTITTGDEVVINFNIIIVKS